MQKRKLYHCFTANVTLEEYLMNTQAKEHITKLFSCAYYSLLCGCLTGLTIFLFKFCAKTAEGVDQLEDVLDCLFGDELPCDGSILTNARHAEAISRAGKSIDCAIQSMKQDMTPDAVLVDVEAAMEALGEITGQTMREEITNRIFERFCVGK